MKTLIYDDRRQGRSRSRSAATARSTRSSSPNALDVAASCSWPSDETVRARDRRAGRLRRPGRAAAPECALLADHRRPRPAQLRRRRQPGRRPLHRRACGGATPSPRRWADLRAGARRRRLPALRQRRSRISAASRSAHIFKLGTKYSEAMNCNLHRRGRRQTSR